jgi:CheY-like chemotaxis protein
VTGGADRIGLMRVRGNCCLFTWRGSATAAAKTVDIRDEHCAQCIDDLRRLSPDIRLVDRRTPRHIQDESPCRVLVVDDDLDVRVELAAGLRDLGCEVVCADNGEQALDYLRSGAPLPGLILLDLMMPVMDGNEFREHQRNDPLLAKIPVVVVTAGREPSRLPFAAIVRKPFRMDTIGKMVNKHRFS